MRRFAPTLAALVALALPSAAQAATPTGATVDAGSRPTFTWTTAAGEMTPAIYVARTPELDADGSLKTLHEYESFADGTTTWTAPEGMLAGTYYWQVSGLDAEYDRHFSPVQQLVVAPIMRGFSASLRCTGRKKLSLRSGWVTNVADLKYSVNILQGRRSMAKLNYTEYLYASKVGTEIREDHDWVPMFASSFRKGTTFRAVLKITGPGVKINRTIVARCR